MTAPVQDPPPWPAPPTVTVTELQTRLEILQGSIYHERVNAELLDRRRANRKLWLDAVLIIIGIVLATIMAWLGMQAWLAYPLTGLPTLMQVVTEHHWQL